MAFLTKSKRKQPVADAPVEEQEVEQESALEKVTKSITINPAKVQRQIEKLLKFSSFEPEQRYWLDTGCQELNAVLGSKTAGIPYGKIIELSGKESAGKTTLTTILAGMAQRDGASVGYIDLEDSRDEAWAGKLGLDMSQVIQIWPKLIVRRKKKKGDKDFVVDDPNVSRMVGKMLGKEAQLESAEMLFEEAEAAMRILAEQGAQKQFWFLDSVANIQTEMVVEAGVSDQNMRTKLDRAMFLSLTLPRWAALAANYNATIVMINQLRDKQGLVFGKPTYTPGGRALRHACAIRAEVSPISGGALKNAGVQIGVKGKIKNEKNKAGNGSHPNAIVGFKIRWDKSPAKISFMPVEEAE
jgi:recombination protein RecA